MIFGVYYLAALILAAADWRGRLATWKIALPALDAWAWCAVLLCTYAAQLFIVLDAAQKRPWPIPGASDVPVSEGATESK